MTTTALPDDIAYAFWPHPDRAHTTFKIEVRPGNPDNDYPYKAFILRCQWDRQGRLLEALYVKPFAQGSGHSRSTARARAEKVLLRDYVSLGVAWRKDRKHGFMNYATAQAFGCADLNV